MVPKLGVICTGSRIIWGKRYTNGAFSAPGSIAGNGVGGKQHTGTQKVGVIEKKCYICVD